MELIAQEINQYDIGVYLLRDGNLNNKYAMPNKLYEFVQARLADAVRLYTAELATEEAKPAPGWVQISHLNNQLGMALGGAGQYDKALEYFQKSLAIKLKRISRLRSPSGGRLAR